MAESKQPAPARAAPVPAPPELRLAAASGDAGVQNLIAAREIHARNGEDAAVAAVDAALAELGFTV